MILVTVIFGVLAVVGWVCCYVNARRLKQWADFCQHGRIAIAYKRRVKLQAPLTEFVLWAKQLDKDKDSNGRVIYSMGGTSVAITKATPPSPKKQPVKQGKYTTQDDTPKENKGGESSGTVHGMVKR